MAHNIFAKKNIFNKINKSDFFFVSINRRTSAILFY